MGRFLGWGRFAATIGRLSCCSGAHVQVLTMDLGRTGLTCPCGRSVSDQIGWAQLIRLSQSLTRHDKEELPKKGTLLSLLGSGRGVW